MNSCHGAATSGNGLIWTKRKTPQGETAAAVSPCGVKDARSLGGYIVSAYIKAFRRFAQSLSDLLICSFCKRGRQKSVTHKGQI